MYFNFLNRVLSAAFWVVAAFSAMEPGDAMATIELRASEGSEESIKLYGETYSWSGSMVEYTSLGWSTLSTHIPRVFPDRDEKTVAKAKLKDVLQEKLITHGDLLDAEVMKLAQELNKKNPNEEVGYYFALVHEHLGANLMTELTSQLQADSDTVGKLNQCQALVFDYYTVLYLNDKIFPE